MRLASLRRLPIITCDQVERAFWIVLAVLSFAIYSLILLHLGGYLAIDAAKHEAAKIVTAKRANPATWQGPLLGCEKHDRAEYARICSARARMTAIGAPK